MSLPLPTPQVEGIRLNVMPFRTDAVIGTMALPTLLQLVPSPRNQENKRAMQYLSGQQRRNAELRGEVQRMIATTTKGKNITPYACYIADGLKGRHGAGWSTPPVTLWLAGEPGSLSDELAAGANVFTMSVMPGSPVVAVDGETQVSAWHELYDDPERVGLSLGRLASVRIPFELYWGLGVDDARQIFYDRNVKGVEVAKNLAMSMDQRDFCTRLVRRVIETVEVESDGRAVPFSTFVDTRGRQLKKSGREFVTLSALRGLVVTALHGRAGLQRGPGGSGEELPDGVSAENATARLAPLLSRLLARLYPEFAARSTVTSPAALAGLGIVVHEATGWSAGGRPLSEEELFRLLASVRWERDARYWDGVAASANQSGILNFRGGAKDAGGRVADAILHPDSEFGRKIRGW